MIRALVVRKNLSDISDAVTIARKIMLQLFINGDHQKAKGAEHVWRKLITVRNCSVEQKFNSDNVLNFPLAINRVGVNDRI